MKSPGDVIGSVSSGRLLPMSSHSHAFGTYQNPPPGDRTKHFDHTGGTLEGSRAQPGGRSLEKAKGKETCSAAANSGTIPSGSSGKPISTSGVGKNTSETRSSSSNVAPGRRVASAASSAAPQDQDRSFHVQSNRENQEWVPAFLDSQKRSKTMPIIRKPIANSVTNVPIARKPVAKPANRGYTRSTSGFDIPQVVGYDSSVRNTRAASTSVGSKLSPNVSVGTYGRNAGPRREPQAASANILHRSTDLGGQVGGHVSDATTISNYEDQGNTAVTRAVVEHWHYVVNNNRRQAEAFQPEEVHEVEKAYNMNSYETNRNSSSEDWNDDSDEDGEDDGGPESGNPLHSVDGDDENDGENSQVDSDDDRDHHPSSSSDDDEDNQVHAHHHDVYPTNEDDDASEHQTDERYCEDYEHPQDYYQNYGHDQFGYQLDGYPQSYDQDHRHQNYEHPEYKYYGGEHQELEYDKHDGDGYGHDGPKPNENEDENDDDGDEDEGFRYDEQDDNDYGHEEPEHYENEDDGNGDGYEVEIPEHGEHVDDDYGRAELEHDEDEDEDESDGHADKESEHDEDDDEDHGDEESEHEEDDDDGYEGEGLEYGEHEELQHDGYED